MKKPNEGNSGVRNIVHRGEAECTIFRTPLLPELVFFHAPRPGEVCIQFTPRHISHFVSSKDAF